MRYRRHLEPDRPYKPFCEFCHPGTALWVKAEGQHHHYTGRFSESKHKPGLGMKPFIVISVFVKSVARSDKPLFSSSKC